MKKFLLLYFAIALTALAQIKIPLSDLDGFEYAPRLSRWQRNGISGKTGLLVGDSTVWQIDGFTTTATAVVSGGAVTSIGTIVNPSGGPSGTWFGLTPVIYLSGGGGTGATATATVTGTAITGFTITNGGSGYTSAPLVSFGTYWFTRFQYPTGPLAGTRFINFGENGCSLEAWMANSVPHGIDAVIAAKPDLILLKQLTNDARGGSKTQAELEALLDLAIQKLNAKLSTVEIVLVPPAPFLTVDVGSHGYVTPNSSAQDYSDRIIRSYRNVANRYQNVVLCDTHARGFGDTCPTSVGTNYVDQIHQSATGYAATADMLVPIIGVPQPFSPTLAAAAYAAAPTAPWTLYLRAPEDPKNFDPVFNGIVNSSGSGYFRMNWTDPAITMASVWRGDVVAPDGQLPFINTTDATVSIADRQVQLSMTSPVTLTANQPIKVSRSRYFGDEAIRVNYEKTSTWPGRVRVYVQATFPNGMDVSPISGDFAGAALLRTVSSTDTVHIAGQAAYPLTTSGTTFSIQGNGALRIGKTGFDYSAFAGGYGYVFLTLASTGAGHLIAGGAAPSTIVAGTGAGTGGVVTVTNAHDSAFTLNVLTGTSPAGSNANLVTINFAVPFSATPNVTISPANANAAALTGTTAVFAFGSQTQCFVSSGSSALPASTVLIFVVHVTQ